MGERVAISMVPGLVVILFFGGRAFLRQGSLVFRPRRAGLTRSPADLGIPYRDVYLECGDGVRAHGWWVMGERPKAIIYFHGSDGNVTYELPTLRFLQRLGASVLLIDYPGYGQSDGRCRERLCYQAGEAAWAFVHEAEGVPARDVVLFGQSLGSAVATYIAASRECGGLVFQSGFTSVPELASAIYSVLPVAFFWVFSRIRMNSLRRIPACACPALVLHSRADEHIPVRQALRIYDRAGGPKRFVALQGSHKSAEWQRDGEVLTAWEELLEGRTAKWECSERAPIASRN